MKRAAHASRDTRSVEELLSFIEKESQEGQSKKKAKKKPKKKRDTSMDQGSREREASSDYAHQMERTLSGYGKLPKSRMMQPSLEADFKAEKFTIQGVPQFVFGFECYLTWALPCT